MAAATAQQQQQLVGTGVRGMAAAAATGGQLPNSKDGKVLHPDLLNANLKKTQVRCAIARASVCASLALVVACRQQAASQGERELPGPRSGALLREHCSGVAAVVPWCPTAQ
jgi:hypothetical protein